MTPLYSDVSLVTRIGTDHISLINQSIDQTNNKGNQSLAHSDALSCMLSTMIEEKYADLPNDQSSPWLHRLPASRGVCAACKPFRALARYCRKHCNPGNL